MRKPRGKKAELEAWINNVRLNDVGSNDVSLNNAQVKDVAAGQTQPRAFGEMEFEEVQKLLAPISESYLRKLLRESGILLSPMVAGVRQSTLEDLEESLLTLTVEYEQRDPAGRNSVRRLVITAKDHARWAQKDPAKRAEKEESALWLLTWLENPPLFPDWVRIRRSQL